MRVHRISALGLVTFAVVVHAGCDAPTCPPGATGPVDNRDRKAYPNNDSDWVCVHLPPEIPVPDLGGDKPVDPPGPKDMEAVAKAAVFVESCIPKVIYSDGNVNARIDSIYSSVQSWSVHRAISDRVNCFNEKTNGCDAVRECLGIVITGNLFKYWQGCQDGIGMRRVGVAPDPISNYWMNCAGIGLECFPENKDRCGVPREECDYTTELSFCTEDGSRRNCNFSFDEGKGFRYLSPSCAKFGLTCEVGPAGAMCTGAGAACDAQSTDDLIADYGVGIGCNDSNTLRACVNGHEQFVDCSAIAKGFQCIGGSRPHCGADFQCNYDRSNPKPTCNGTLLEVCNGGVRTTIDCAELGFEACDAKRGVCQPRTTNEAP